VGFAKPYDICVEESAVSAKWSRLFASRRLYGVFVAVVMPAAVQAADDQAKAKLPSTVSAAITVPATPPHMLQLAEGSTVAISVHIQEPAKLPVDGRLLVHWELTKADDPQRVPRGPEQSQPPARQINDLGIPAAPTANWSKILHALDPDVYLVYRAPVAGTYRLSVTPAEQDVTVFSGTRWRDGGAAPRIRPSGPTRNWPSGTQVDVDVSVQTIVISERDPSGLIVEAEPNDTPEQAQPIVIKSGTADDTINIVGGSDDIEYFDNGQFGTSGDDWFRLEFPGPEPRLLTACLSIPDQQVAARIRAYRIDPKHVTAGLGKLVPGQLLPLAEYQDGKNPNERAHQQTEQYRTAINRTLKPAGVYFLRVEANAPGYELELRIVRPAPYDRPAQAIRHGLYDHIGQVDAWLTNRPRGASVERRIRDSGNLLGTNCMSCHTQSGVWGPAVPFAQGYRPRNVQAWRHLINTCYQSMRPTNKLVDAANNTSLQPLDLGDGPAGTRVAGHAVVALERFLTPRKLQSKQAIRAANFVLQSGDPGGINAAGPGANVGQGVVFSYAGEIVASAWKETAEPRYFHSLEDKARRMLKINVKYADDLGHRVEFFRRFFPADYETAAAKVADAEQIPAPKKAELLQQAKQLASEIENQVTTDLTRLRAIQLESGGWSFDPGQPAKGIPAWTVKDKKPDPSPTAVALLAFEAAGVSREDPTVARGIAALLKMQHSTGYWNAASQTGFVSTSYALHALSRYYPTQPPKFTPEQFQPAASETLEATIQRVRRLSMTEDAQMTGLLIQAGQHASPLVRYWAMIGLGTTRDDAAIPTVIAGLGDQTKLVREAAHWGLRQMLINDQGWPAVLTAAANGTDYTRASAMRALVMKVDGVLPGIGTDWSKLTGVFDHALNDDRHPAVRAWATRAAWQWWIWNPPVRAAINDAWLRLLEREEPETLVENAMRYQTHALFIANGHIANASKNHQYKQLATLFERLSKALADETKDNEEQRRRLSRRLVAVAATYYNQRGGDGGPGQMGYSTAGAGSLFGSAVLTQLAVAEALPESEQQRTRLQLALEGANNIPHEDLQQKLVQYSLEGPEEFRGLAAASISDPRLVSLIAVAEQLEPMYRQLLRGANEPPRRKNLSDPILKMIGGVKWILPQSPEQRTEILQYLIPNTSTWQTQDALKSLTDAAQKQRAERDSQASWYLAEGLGASVAKNPDLHYAQMAEALPQKLNNAAEARFWIRSVPWILTFKRAVPVVKVDPKKLPPIDPYEELRSRALRLFLDQLGSQALAANRKLAVDLANRTSLKRNPEVLTALSELPKFEKDKPVLEGAKKVLSQQRGTFTKQLAAAVTKEPEHNLPTGPEGQVQLPEDFVTDVTYFRDYVVPEMTRVLRGDERSCMICHGQPGRVPSMELHAPDRVGYLPVDKLLANYRILQHRVNLQDVARSKLLRKPLNVQVVGEDGHQGGRRYQPDDPGYQILTRWVNNQSELQKRFPRPASAKKAK